MVPSRVRGLEMASYGRHVRIVLLTLLAGTASCAPSARVPLAVPLTPVGGSRPATPSGLMLIAAFGDGVWGQEQQRAEMTGGGLGFATGDRFAFSASAYGSTREVRDANGNVDHGEPTFVARGKIRLHDFVGGKASIGVHTALLGSQRLRHDIQNDRLLAWELALPLEFYPLGESFPDHRFGLYVAPRLVFQTLDDRLRGVSTKGTMVGGLLGLTARWRHVALSGELNVAKTPTMSYVGTTFPGGWLALPIAGVSVIIPLGN